MALSGGADSLALAWSAAIELPKMGMSVGAVIVDHQLQDLSAEVAEAARDQAERLGLGPVILKKVAVGTVGGPEEAARTARYQAFNEVLHETGATAVLLAHTEDDQAETVLLGLARGSGPSGLKGMAFHEGRYHRPLLGVSRTTVRHALSDAGIDWWEDPHNQDVAYARVRIRHNVMPVLEDALGPGITAALARTAELFRADSEALDAMANELVAHHAHAEGPHGVVMEVSHLESQPDALASRVVKIMVKSIGGSTPSFVQMKQILALLREWKGQAGVSVAGASVVRKDGHIRVTTASGR